MAYAALACRLFHLVDTAPGDDEVPVDGNGHDGDGGHEDTQIGQRLYQPYQIKIKLYD
jgi:hypothetical protein